LKRSELSPLHPFTLPFLVLIVCAAVLCAAEESAPRVARFTDPASVEVSLNNEKATLHAGDHLGHWTLMQIVQSGTKASPTYAVMEDFYQQEGRLIFVGTDGVKLDLPKASEPTWGDPAKIYRGHTVKEIMDSAPDLLGNEILAKPGDPEYDEVAAAFPPIRKIKTYSFVGTHETIDKVGFVYGGRTPDFDPAPYFPPIGGIRDKGQVRDGLVGGYLPILRFVYPESEGNWTEMIAFAPLRISNDNPRIQPVWYRVVRVENHLFKWAKYIDSYHPFPPRTDYDPNIFYGDMFQLDHGWKQALKQAMKIELPDERIANMSRFALVRDMMTRVGDFPKYGAFDKDYAGSEHDGFPDTFTVDTAAMLDWGLVDLAGRYIDNYFEQFVRDDGSILYRGPETGQYGRMLTLVAQYISYGGDPEILLKRRSRIDGVTNLLLMLRAKAQKLPPTDPAYGMIAGWSEADACLDPDPPRYMQPYFSNSTEAARGFRDLGRAWEKIGKLRKNTELTAWGQKLQREGAELEKDVQTSISRSLLKLNGETILPSIAGVKEPFHIVVPRDESDPQFRSYRAYMEMMYSGSLSKDQVKLITDYRWNHHDTILGLPTAYGHNTAELAGFLSYGHGYGLIQHDMIREALLMMYSDMAHQYTRGTWTAPETRNVLIDRPAAPYCTPAQLVVALMTKWLLVFEDPQSDTVWLGKAVPRDWLEDGKTTRVEDAPTQWGRIGFSMTSHVKSGNVAAEVNLPKGFAAATKLRFRTPGSSPLKSVTLNGKAWDNFDADSETVTIPSGTGGTVNIVANY
jgi:hypothetical protein